MKKKTVLILVNHEIVIYNFRKELVEHLIEEGYHVIISSPAGEKIKKLVELGCVHDDIHINRHGFNPFEEIKLLHHYKNSIKRYKPDIVFSYTIKPNIYGAIASKIYKVPFVANITGLGTAVENPGFLQKTTILLYKFAFSSIQTVFFQNKENQQFFVDNNIALGKHKMLPGSGVNLKHFYLQKYPSTDDTIEFVFISRIMREKGINHFLEAAKYITGKYPNTRFHVAGFCEEEYEGVLSSYQDKKIIKYHGMVDDVRKIMKFTHCTVHPTYYPEGLSNVLLESAATGRAIISTNRSGTKETIDDGVNGYLVNERDTEDLIEKIEKFICLTHQEKRNMGLAGRLKVEKEYNRQIVVDRYIKEINYESGGYH